MLEGTSLQGSDQGEAVDCPAQIDCLVSPGKAVFQEEAYGCYPAKASDAGLPATQKRAIQKGCTGPRLASITALKTA